MCDGINDPGGPRRCPSQRGDRRRAYRRALYAAQKARAVHDPEGPAATSENSADGTKLPSDQDVRAAITTANEAWRTLLDTGATTDSYAYESAVRTVGALVAAQADHEISIQLGDAVEDENAVAAEQAAVDAEVKAISDEADQLKAWRHDVISRLRSHRSSGLEAQDLGAKESAWVAELNRRIDALNTRNKALDEAKRRRGIQEGRIIATVMSRYRDYGTRTASIHDTSSARAHKLLEDASAVYPADWVSDSDNGIDMIVKESKKRAQYRGLSRQTVRWTADYDPPARLVTGHTWRTRKEMGPAPSTPAADAVTEAGIELRASQVGWVAVRDPESRRWQWKIRARGKSTRMLSEMRVPSKDQGAGFSYATTIHEFGHRVEAHNPRLGAACLAFRDRRTTGADGRLHPPQQYAKGEFVRPDEFVNAYIGKDYGSTVHSEVLSMGMESVFGGSQGSLRGYYGERADPEHRHLVLGLCASA